MSSPATLSCRCLCGAVRFEATPKHQQMDACHCGMCRRWTGGIFLTVDCGANVTITDSTHLGVYSSSDFAERCFCRKCGSILLWRTHDRTMNMVSTQALEHPESFLFAAEIFIDDKPANYDFANPTKKMTGAEVMAMFAAEHDKP